MKVGIVIVTYNNQKDISRLLESINIQTYRNFVVYIVDNNSNDDTLSIIQKYQSEINIFVISSRINTGFAKGNNIGIQNAMDKDCDLVFILNPDMQLEDKCIDILVKRIMSDNKVGVIGPIVLYGNDPDNIIQAYGVMANFRTQKKVGPFANEKWTNDLPAEISVDFVLGGAMMIRGSILKTTGSFEEDYFMYNDELDIAYRIKKTGFKTLCVRDAIVRHFHDFSKRNKTGYNIMYYYVIRNRYLYFKKFHLYFNLALSLIVELISFPLKVIWSIRRMGNVKLLKFYYSGLLDGLLSKRGIANKSFDGKKKTKEIILTIDYEIFLGDITGTTRECMIEPSEKLVSILEKNGSKMTVFWDIIQYYRLLELEKSFSELYQVRLMIKKQILDFAMKGHDIQLHLHPHWLDANYENGTWIFSYERFKLHNLSDENNPEDINTISGCVTISKSLMEDLIRKVKPDYEVTTFRAGGYLLEPFDKLKDAFLKNGIKIDSSVCPELYNFNETSSYDFRFYPQKQKYNFEITPKEILKEGSFIEIPITTLKLPILKNIYYKFVRRLKYSDLENERKGVGIGSSYENIVTLKTRTLVSRLFTSNRNQLTTDSNFREKFDYLFKKAPAYSTMILHPKLLNSHTHAILDEYVSSNKIRFISIQDYLSDNS